MAFSIIQPGPKQIVAANAEHLLLSNVILRDHNYIFELSVVENDKLHISGLLYKIFCKHFKIVFYLCPFKQST